MPDYVDNFRKQVFHLHKATHYQVFTNWII